MSEGFDMDKLTLEFFTNKQTYRKYLAKKDPEANVERTRTQMVEKHDALVDLFSQMIQQPEEEEVRTVQPSFLAFVQAALLHLEKLEEETAVPDSLDEVGFGKKDDDDENLFAQCEDLRTQPSNPIEFWKMQQVLKR